MAVTLVVTYGTVDMFILHLDAQQLPVTLCVLIFLGKIE